MAATGVSMRRVILLALVLAASTRAGSAQDVPVPPRLGSLWSFTLNAQDTWLSNANFSLTDEDSAFLDRAGAGLSYQRLGQRSSFVLGAQAAAVLSRGRELREDETSLNYSGNLGWQVQISPRLNLRLSNSYSTLTSQGGLDALDSFLSDPGGMGTQPLPPAPVGSGTIAPPLSLGILPQEIGLVYPLAEMRTNQTELSLGYQPFVRTTLIGTVRYDRMDFEGEGLLDGDQLAASGGIGWMVGPLGTIGASYTWSRTESEGRSGESQSASANWSRTVGSRVGFTFSGSLGGTRATFAEAPEEDPRFLLTWNIGLGVAVPDSRKGVPTLSFSRAVTPAYGLGRDRIANILSVGYTLRTSRRTSLSANGSYNWNEDPTDPAFDFSSQNYGGAFRYEGQKAGTNISYALRRTDLGASELVQSHSVSVGVSYGWQWR